MVATKKKADFTIRTQQFTTNKLLNRKQFLVELTHPNWCGTVPLKQVRKKLASLYKVADENTISLFGFKTKFGGGRTSGFGLIYDDIASLKRLEPNYRKTRLGCGKKKSVSRRSLKDRKNRAKKVRGKKKNAAAAAKKKK
jgi:small subunit ribosomal protein S24e